MKADFPSVPYRILAFFKKPNIAAVDDNRALVYMSTCFAEEICSNAYCNPKIIPLKNYTRFTPYHEIFVRHLRRSF